MKSISFMVLMNLVKTSSQSEAMLGLCISMQFRAKRVT
jgi:hypothetical protein